MDRKTLYKCDPYKNAECKKTGCYIHGGMCDGTTEKQYARTDENGAPVTNEFKPRDEIEQAWRAGYLQGLAKAESRKREKSKPADPFITVKICGKLPSLNEYIEACRRNPHCGAKMKANTEAVIIPQLAKLPKIDKPVHISFIWQEANKRRDKDNVAAGKKFILDALQKASKLINDNNDYIAGFTDRFEYGGKEYGCTLIIEGAENRKDSD